MLPMSTSPVPFGKYELVSKLAAGGMAEIYLARTKSIQGFEKYLVIKKILRNRASDPEFIRMFLDEARVAATLDHPNIVQIYDVGSVDEEYFIAMEYLRGKNLIEIVRGGAKLGYSKPPLEHVCSALSAVCAGLHYAHEKRDMQGRPLEIVHRDITPQNIVINFDGAVKVVDFGIAKAATREVETLAGTLKGKIGYMSPEQCRGLAVDRRSDVFAIGIILYELTTGKRLYHERSDFETLKKIIEGPVPSPREILPFYPAALNTIVVRCLQKNPEDRYQSARELHADLDAFARDNQLVTGTVPLSQYMERIFADELASQKEADPSGSGLALAQQMQGSTASSYSYLGEASRRSSLIEAPLAAARRQLVMTRVYQAAAAIGLMVAAGTFVWWRVKPAANVQSLAVVAPVAPPPALVPAAAPPPAQVAAAAAPAPAAPAAPAAVAVAPAPVPGLVAKPKPAPKPGDAHITVASTPSCELLVDGTPYGATPVIDVAVPAGRHSIVLLNSAANIRETQKVSLSTGQLWSRQFSWGTDGKAQLSDKLSPKAMQHDGPAPAAIATTEPKKDAAPATHPHPAEGAASTSAVAAPAPTAVAAAPAPVVAPKPVAPPPAAPPPPPTTRTVAGFVLDSQKVSGQTPHLPDFVINKNKGMKLTGNYRICVNKDGRVGSVTTIGSISGGDSVIEAAIKSWTYKPQPITTCATKMFSYDLTH